MDVSVLTLFPEMVWGALNHSILKRARDKSFLNLDVLNIRDFTEDKHRRVDDVPYGGGAGMILKLEPLHAAIISVMRRESRLLMLAAAGQKFDQSCAKSLASEKHLILICGHYEGIDARVRALFNPLCVSVGDYVLTNGALAACVVIDAVARLIPGVLGNENSVKSESFENNQLEYPQYTKPQEFQGLKVPPVLLSGNHAEIEKWRIEQSKKITEEFRKA
jgi:tRNA (guanine37-N1)-methyltransferase